jgi:hypothetical protein
MVIVQGKTASSYAAFKLMIPFTILCCSVLLFSLALVIPEESTFSFQDNLAIISTDRETCLDSTRLMPECTACIPGLFSADDNSTCIISPETTTLRAKIKAIAEDRYKVNDCRLYPYLSMEPFTKRQQDVGLWISQEDKPRRILDIGPYTNPIHRFFQDPGYCPDMIVYVEPCGELCTSDGITPWESSFIPCAKGKDRTKKFTHVIVSSTTAREYLESSHFHDTKFDAVVCIGCDGDFGPKIGQLKKIAKPFFLYVEYPVAYPHSRKAFQPSSIRNRLCGSSSTQARHSILYRMNVTTTEFTERYLASYLCGSINDT